MTEEDSEYQVNDVVTPAMQQSLLFYDKPLVVIRLLDGEPAVVLSHLCENMGLERTAQLRRVQRTKALSRGLHYAQINTDGGPQVMAVLTLRVLPAWLFRIDATRARPEIQPEIERYQEECVDVLYNWAKSVKEPKVPDSLVPTEQVVKPDIPPEGSPLDDWDRYYRGMVEWVSWRRDMAQWRGTIDHRVGNLETVTSRILEQIGPPRITPEHQALVQYSVSELSRATGRTHQALFAALKTAFRVPRYDEIPESEWVNVEQWFKRQMPGQTLPPAQEKLF